MKTYRLGNYGLGWILLALFLVSWAGQSWTGWREFKSEQATHGQPAEIFGTDGYVWNWAQSTLENWQSEFLQLLTMAVLTSFLIFKNSAESRDSDDETKDRLERIEQRLNDLADAATTTPNGVAARGLASRGP